MTRRDWIAVLAFVLGVGGGLWWVDWRAKQRAVVWCEAPDGTRMLLGDQIIYEGETFVCVETNTWILER